MTTLTKEIKFDRISKDFAYYLDGRLIGYAPNYRAADEALNEAAYDQLVADADLDAEIDAMQEAV